MNRFRKLTPPAALALAILLPAVILAARPQPLAHGNRPPARPVAPTLGTHPVTGPQGEFPVSVVSAETAEALFRELAGRREIPFNYVDNGCYARAHHMARLLEARGVIAGKVFVNGELRVELPPERVVRLPGKDPVRVAEWAYHVAPIVAVREYRKGAPHTDREGRQYEDVLTVIDPSAFVGPVPVESLTSLRHGRGASVLAPRYYYQPQHLRETIRDWRREDLEAAEATLRNFRTDK